MSSKLTFRSWRRRLQLFGGSPAPSSWSSTRAAAAPAPRAPARSGARSGRVSRPPPRASPRPERRLRQVQLLGHLTDALAAGSHQLHHLGLVLPGELSPLSSIHGLHPPS